MLQNSLGTLLGSLDAALSWRRIATAALGIVSIIVITGILFAIALDLSSETVGDIVVWLGLLIAMALFALFSGALAHHSWEDIERDEQVTIKGGVQFGVANITQLILSPLVLLLVIVVLVVAELLLILIGRIPYLGEIWITLIFFPLLLVNVLLVIGLTIGLWLIFPITAEGGRTISQNIGRVISLVRKAPAALVGTYLLAVLLIAVAVSIFMGMLLIVFNTTTSLVEVGLEEKWASILAASQFGQLLAGFGVATVTSPLDQLMIALGGGRSAPFTYKLASNLLGIGTLALTLGILLAFPWSFLITVSSKLYHNLRDSLGENADELPNFSMPSLQLPNRQGQPAFAGAAPATQAVTPKLEMVDCSSCGKSIGKNLKFCIHCGASQIAVDVDSSSEQN